MSSLIKNWIPWMKESSSIEPSAHQPALFLIQSGIILVFSGFKRDLDLIWKSDVEIIKFSKFSEFLPVKINLISYCSSVGIKIDSW